MVVLRNHIFFVDSRCALFTLMSKRKYDLWITSMEYIICKLIQAKS